MFGGMIIVTMLINIFKKNETILDISRTNY